MTQVSFPGLFDKIININPVAFSVFGLEVRWYGLIICIGIILAVANTVRCAHKEGISTDDVLDYAIWVIPLAIIGARAYYVLTSLSDYKSFSEAIAIWNGGLAIYGGIIAGAITVFVVSKIKKISFIKMADSIATSLLIGQMIGRWGNFCNGEAFGHLDRIEFLGKVIPTPGFMQNYFLRMGVNSTSTFGWEFVHPTFLYESVWNLLGLVLITLLYRKKKFDGQIILSYFAWYGLGRFFIEGLRTDSLYLWGNIKISQLLALVTCILSVAMIISVLVKLHKQRAEGSEYVSQFAFDGQADTVSNDNDEQADTAEGDISASDAKEAPDDTNTSDITTEEKENGNNN